LRRSLAGLVLDVGGEPDGCPWQVLGVEVVDLHADRVQRGAVDGVAGRNESNAAGEAEQNPGPPSAMTMTLPS
jgi:hypothetical protein